jgi:regulator of RNase E activity RraA
MTTETLLLHPDIARTLVGITTATLSTVLLEKGLRNVWMRGPAPLAGNRTRQAGRAFTLRFVPAREDLATPAAWASPVSTRTAIEAMPAGCIAVVDAMGVTTQGFSVTFCARGCKNAVSARLSRTASFAT